MSMIKNRLYFGSVYHARHIPFQHEFKYKVFTFFIEIDSLPRLDQDLPRFSYNKWNIFSFHNKDHGYRDGRSIRQWIEQSGKEKNMDLTETRIMMLGFARQWGYAFNPLTVFFIYDKDENLIAVMHQVKNTFGEQHSYLLPVKDNKDIISQDHEKVFHVSPFIHMDCHYHFKFKQPGDDFFFAIHQQTPDGKILTATWDGIGKDLNEGSLKKALFKHPFMTFKVIAAIHWEALKLVLKGAKYIKKPQKPKKDVS